MAKQETDARASRAVTETDLQIIDGAITAHEGLGGFLYRTRYILWEIGKLEKHYHDIKSGIGVAEQQRDRLGAELEGVQAQLAKAQKETAERQNEVAQLAREIEQKEQLLRHYSQTIDRIMGTAA
jgi:predicted  nucleic acid-binding Zn-ribbon protein